MSLYGAVNTGSSFTVYSPLVAIEAQAKKSTTVKSRAESVSVTLSNIGDAFKNIINNSIKHEMQPLWIHSLLHNDYTASDYGDNGFRLYN